MTIDQLIEAYTYARVSGSSKSLKHLDLKAKDFLKSTSFEDANYIFSEDEYEAKLRYVRSERVRPNSHV